MKQLINAVLLCTFLSSCTIHSMDLDNAVAWVKTNDNWTLNVSRQDIKQIKTLQLLLAHQKRVNCYNNPINAYMTNRRELQLICAGLAAPNIDKFNTFYDHLDRENLNLLINATDTLEVPLLRILCAQKAFPTDIQKQINQHLTNAITGFFMRKNISKKPVSLKYTDCSYGDFASITWSGDDQYIASTSSTNSFEHYIMWNTTSGKIIWCGDTPELRCLMSSLAFNSKSTEIVFSWNKPLICSLSTMNISDKKIIKKFPQKFKNSPCCIAWSPDDTKIALGFPLWEPCIFQGEKNFHLIDALTAETIMTQKIKDFSTIAFYPDNKTVIAISHKHIQIWDIYQPENIRTFDMPYKGYSYNAKVALNPDRTKIIIGGIRSPIVLSLITGKKIMNLSRQRSECECVAWSPDGTKIATGAFHRKDPSITIWDALTGDKLIQLHNPKTTAIAFNATSKKIVAAGCADESPVIYTLLTDKEEENIAQLKNLDIVQLWLTYELIRKTKNTTHIQNPGLESAVFNTLTELTKKLLTTDF